MAKKKNSFRDPRWALWQVYCNKTPVGKPVLAVSEKQAIHIRRDQQTGTVLYDKWTAIQISLTMEESEALAEHETDTPKKGRNRACRNCGYFDPSPTADICPSCGTAHYSSPD